MGLNELEVMEKMGDLYDKVTPLMEDVEEIMQDLDDDEQLAGISYLCMEMIAGFDNKEAMYKILEVTKAFVDNLELDED